MSHLSCVLVCDFSILCLWLFLVKKEECLQQPTSFHDKKKQNSDEPVQNYKSQMYSHKWYFHIATWSQMQ